MRTRCRPEGREKYLQRYLDYRLLLNIKFNLSYGTLTHGFGLSYTICLLFYGCLNAVVKSLHKIQSLILYLRCFVCLLSHDLSRAISMLRWPAFDRQRSANSNCLSRYPECNLIPAINYDIGQ